VLFHLFEGGIGLYSCEVGKHFHSQHQRCHQSSTESWEMYPLPALLFALFARTSLSMFKAVSAPQGLRTTLTRSNLSLCVESAPKHTKCIPYRTSRLDKALGRYSRNVESILSSSKYTRGRTKRTQRTLSLPLTKDDNYPNGTTDKHPSMLSLLLRMSLTAVLQTESKVQHFLKLKTLPSFDIKLHYTDAWSQNDVPENNVPMLDLRRERSPGMSLAQMLTAIGEAGAKLALGPEE